MFAGVDRMRRRNLVVTHLLPDYKDDTLFHHVVFLNLFYKKKLSVDDESTLVATNSPLKLALI